MSIPLILHGFEREERDSVYSLVFILLLGSQSSLANNWWSIYIRYEWQYHGNTTRSLPVALFTCATYSKTILGNELVILNSKRTYYVKSRKCALWHCTFYKSSSYIHALLLPTLLHNFPLECSYFGTSGHYPTFLMLRAFARVCAKSLQTSFRLYTTKWTYLLHFSSYKLFSREICSYRSTNDAQFAPYTIYTWLWR